MSTRIREFRKLRGMTLQHLAQKVGTTAQTIQRLETGNMTVSLDWLHKIADAFGVPAAALIVSETTASVTVLGEVGGNGMIVAASPDAVPITLSLVIAAPRPIAVKVAGRIAGFEVGTMLIADRTDFDPDFLSDGRRCVVALKSGEMLFRRVTTSTAGTALAAPDGDDNGEAIAAEEIDWIAPILMAIQYF